MHICFLNFVFPDSKHHESQVEENQGNRQGVREYIWDWHTEMPHSSLQQSWNIPALLPQKPSELSWQNVLVILSSSQPAMPQLSQVNAVIIKFPKHTHSPTHNTDETQQKHYYLTDCLDCQYPNIFRLSISQSWRHELPFHPAATFTWCLFPKHWIPCLESVG